MYNLSITIFKSAVEEEAQQTRSTQPLSLNFHRSAFSIKASRLHFLCETLCISSVLPFVLPSVHLSNRTHLPLNYLANLVLHNRALARLFDKMARSHIRPILLR